MDHKFISSTKFFSEVTKTVYLYGKVWREATTALIHGPRALDKSAGALDIALDIARGGREVLYVNAGDRLGRLAGSDAGHENLYMFTPEFESIDDTSDYADLVFEAIEQAVRTTSIRTFVIDSVSRIAALSFGRNASVAYLMKRLVALQVKGRLSVLVVADDGTKSVNNALAALAAARSQSMSLSNQTFQTSPKSRSCRSCQSCQGCSGCSGCSGSQSRPGGPAVKSCLSGSFATWSAERPIRCARLALQPARYEKSGVSVIDTPLLKNSVKEFLYFLLRLP